MSCVRGCPFPPLPGYQRCRYHQRLIDHPERFRNIDRTAPAMDPTGVSVRDSQPASQVARKKGESGMTRAHATKFATRIEELDQAYWDARHASCADFEQRHIAIAIPQAGLCEATGHGIYVNGQPASDQQKKAIQQWLRANGGKTA